MTEGMVRVRGGAFLMGSDRTPSGGRARSKAHYIGWLKKQTELLSYEA